MDHTWNKSFTNIDLRRRMITYEKVNEREIIDHHRTAKERKSPMTIHSKFLAMSILLMTQHIALAQYDCGGGVIQSIKNNWNDSVSRISITTDNTIPRASNKYLYEGSVMINTDLGTAPYADIIETITAAYTAGSYVHFYQTPNVPYCTSIDFVRVCKSSNC